MFRPLTRLRGVSTAALLLTCALVLLVLPTPAGRLLYAQTALTTSTLASAVTSTSASSIVVTSATGLAAGEIVFVDHEAMVIRPEYVSGTTVPVMRGQFGTAATAHAALAVFYNGTTEHFSSNTPVPAVGAVCAANAEVADPKIFLPSGRVFDCVNSVWTEIGAAFGTVQVAFVQGATPADALDSIFFLADRPYVVTAVSAVWGTAESTGAMAIMVEKLTGTTACASGTDILSASIDAATTANTVATGALSATASALQLAAGNRLCVDLTATPNEVANMVVTVTLAPR